VVLGATVIGIIRLPGSTNVWLTDALQSRSVAATPLQAVAILSVGALVGLASHTIDESGFLKNQAAVGTVQAAFHSTFLPKLSTDELQDRLHDPDVVIIDARRAIDFRAGHIEGAINIPVNATATERSNILSSVSPSSEVVIYCQSATCTYAEKVANAIAFSGYENVSLYREGWREWERAQSSK
jgi:3-mercaptopyruvate sulfurtransferase SseA